MKNQKNELNIPTYLAELKYLKDIRASWTSNKSHFDPNSSSKRNNNLKKGKEFSPVWLGEIGFLRYYLFLIDNGYIPGKSKLQRIDQDKGFAPDNCFILHTEIKNSNLGKKKTKQKTVIDETYPTEVINNNIFIIDGNADIAALLKSLNIKPQRVLGELN